MISSQTLPSLHLLTTRHRHRQCISEREKEIIMPMLFAEQEYGSRQTEAHHGHSFRRRQAPAIITSRKFLFTRETATSLQQHAADYLNQKTAEQHGLKFWATESAEG